MAHPMLHDFEEEHAMPQERPALSSSRLVIVLVVAVLSLVSFAIVATWPTLIRHVVTAQIGAMTHRPVSIKAIHLNPLTGRADVEGLKLLDRDGQTPFAVFDRLRVSVRPLALLGGHLWIREVI